MGKKGLVSKVLAAPGLVCHTGDYTGRGRTGMRIDWSRRLRARRLRRSALGRRKAGQTAMGGCGQGGMERGEVTHHPLVEIDLVRVHGLGMLRGNEKQIADWATAHTWRRLSRRENCLPQWQANGRSPVCFLNNRGTRWRKNGKDTKDTQHRLANKIKVEKQGCRHRRQGTRARGQEDERGTETAERA